MMSLQCDRLCVTLPCKIPSVREGAGMRNLGLPRQLRDIARSPPPVVTQPRRAPCALARSRRTFLRACRATEHSGSLQCGPLLVRAAWLAATNAWAWCGCASARRSWLRPPPSWLRRLRRGTTKTASGAQTTATWTASRCCLRLRPRTTTASTSTGAPRGAARSSEAVPHTAKHMPRRCAPHRSRLTRARDGAGLSRTMTRRRRRLGFSSLSLPRS
jgi:hypothetical protein